MSKRKLVLAALAFQRFDLGVAAGQGLPAVAVRPWSLRAGQLAFGRSVSRGRAIQLPSSWPPHWNMCHSNHQGGDDPDELVAVFAQQVQASRYTWISRMVIIEHRESRQADASGGTGKHVHRRGR